MQYVAVGLDSVALHHKLGNEWETLYSMAVLLLDLLCPDIYHLHFCEAHWNTP